MATVSIVADELRVSIGFFEGIRAVQRSFTVPLSHVRGATEDSNYLNEGLGLRSPGTGLPGLIAEGTFRKNDQRVLALWKRGQRIVVIELANEKWDRLLIGCDDSKALTDSVNDAIASR